MAVSWLLRISVRQGVPLVFGVQYISIKDNEGGMLVSAHASKLYAM
jgi:hypothetical protein